MIDRTDENQDPSEGGGVPALQAEIARAFHFWNARCWQGELPLPVFNFHPQPPNGHMLGHYLESAWTPGDRRRKHPDEIVFYADLCLQGGINEVLHTLVHEMTHVWQHHFGKPGQHNFHNAQWHREVQRVGLLTTPPDRVGHSSPGKGFEEALREFAPRVTGIPFRILNRKGIGPGGRGKLRRWICNCGFGVRVAVSYFNATCNVCGEIYCLDE